MAWPAVADRHTATLKVEHRLKICVGDANPARQAGHRLLPMKNPTIDAFGINRRV
jgi:hypothetical protein